MKLHKNNAQKKDFAVFRRWGRKNYSLYSVFHKVVKISVLSVSYFLAVPVLSVAMEPDTTAVKMQYDLDEIEVTASRAPMLYSQVARIITVIGQREIERAPVESIQEMLENVAGMDIRQRGAGGVQADISIRGGSFDQTMILLNGINITDPQTGHHNLNLPVSLSQIERIEILEGPAARAYGPNAFSGAINIVTKSPSGNSLAAELSAGNFGFLNTGVSGGFKTGQLSHLLSGNLKKSDGYIENTDFSDLTFFYSAGFQSYSGRLALQLGVSDKEFGANSFYTPVYPEQYEQTRTTFSSVKWESNKPLHFSPAFYWRSHTDKFMLFRNEAPDWYKNHNYHRTDVAGVNLNAWILWLGGKTAFGTDFRWENILSNVLGDELETPKNVRGEEAFYSKSKNRSLASLFLEHSWLNEKWSFSAGVMANHISESGTGIRFFPGIDISFQVIPAVKWVASWNASMRMPTFTDLYYSGPTNIGNPNLKPEKTSAVESGFKFSSDVIHGHVVFYHRKGKNLIDWVKKENDELWKSMNHTELNSSGAEIHLQCFPAKQLVDFLPGQVRFSYHFNHQEKEETALISYYVLDNLRHKFITSVNQNISKGLSANVNFIFQKREGTFTRFRNGHYVGETGYEPFWLVDTKISYQRNKFRLFVSLNNLFDKDYFDLGNIVQPGRWVKAGISFQTGADR